MSSTNRQSPPPSLRSRYIRLSLLVGILVIGIVLLIYLDVLKTSQKVSYRQEVIHRQLDGINDIRNNIINLYRNINHFLLDPTLVDHPDDINASIEDSIDISHNILQEIAVSNENRATLESLIQKFQQLDSSVRLLVEIRMDVNRQYPAMSISAIDMGQPQSDINGYFSVLLDEIETGGFKPKSAQLYPLLLKTGTLWAKAISQVRIYLANRFASFSTDILIIQAESLTAICEKLEQNLARLQQLYESEDGSFEGPASIAASQEKLQEWRSIFSLVREISESPNWRRDSYILETSVIPMIDAIASILLDIDARLREQEHQATDLLKRNSNKIFATLAFIILLFLFFVVAILLSLEWMVFRPISNVALALRSKAFGTKGPNFAPNQSLETRLLIEAFQEMDQQVSNRENALQHQAMHDALTSLPNRAMLNQRLNYHLIEARRNNKIISLFVLDLDRFKDVNDSLGHKVGDQLLIQVASRLNDCMRDIDTIARLGGDEFAVILPDTSKKQSVVVAEKISRSIAEVFEINGQAIHIGVSIGIVSYPDDGHDSHSLLQHADIAMYSAKRNRQDYAHYNAGEDQESLNLIALINDLRNALIEDTLEIYFQPRIDFSNSTPVGAEALLRWHHPEIGQVRPEKIIDLAEHYGLINELTVWVIDNAIRHCRQWHDLGYSLSVSINLSVQNLTYSALCDEVQRCLQKHQVDSQYITLEITENGMMANPGRSIDALNRLHDMGINLSIDDFGTGFSSLAYLKQLPVNEVKIDKSFVIDMVQDENDATIVQSIINLGHNLGLRVVAEGVETEQVYQILQDLHCDYAQGFLIQRPIAASDFIDWLRGWTDKIAVAN